MSATSRNDSGAAVRRLGRRAAGHVAGARSQPGSFDDGWNLIRPQLLRDDDPATWNLGRRVLDAAAEAGWDSSADSAEIRLAVLCSYESAELREHLRVACRAFGSAATSTRRRTASSSRRPARGHAAHRASRRRTSLIAPTTARPRLPRTERRPRRRCRRPSSDALADAVGGAARISRARASSSTASSCRTRRRSATCRRAFPAAGLRSSAS